LRVPPSELNGAPQGKSNSIYRPYAAGRPYRYPPLWAPWLATEQAGSFLLGVSAPTSRRWAIT
jgi:hypothetical protein